MTLVIAGRYRLRRLIARGGVARIYEAIDLKARRRVVVKLPRKDVPFDASKLLENEARSLSRLEHPYVVRLVDKGRLSEGSFVVLEYLEGESLSKLVVPPVDPAWALDVGLDVADALAYVNSRGIAHRDVKPSNIIISPRRLVLIDFTVSAPIGRRGVKAETPGFSCPEAAAGLSTPTCDSYSLSALMSWLVTGDSHSPGGPYWRVLQACLTPCPKDRPMTVSQLAAALRAALPLGPRLVVGGRAYPLVEGCALRVGRSAECEVRIEDPHRYVSPVHAAVVLERGEAYVYDNDSLNGVFLYRDGRYVRIRWSTLRDGDVIVLCYSEKKGPYVVMKYRAF